MYHTRLSGGFSRLDFFATNRVPTPNGASLESSRRDASNAGLFGTDSISQLVEISSIESQPRVCCV